MRQSLQQKMNLQINAEAISETVENNGDAASYWADTIKDVLLDTQYNCCLKS